MKLSIRGPVDKWKNRPVNESICRNYVVEYGGWGLGDDEPWYDCDVITKYEGDRCPECGQGRLRVSARNKLYCSALCWLDKEE